MSLAEEIQSRADSTLPSSDTHDVLHLYVLTKQNPSGIRQDISVATLHLHYDFHDVYTSIYRKVLQDYIPSPSHFIVDMPLHTLLRNFRFLDLKGLRRLCYIHMLHFRNKSKKQLHDDLSAHQCLTLCGSAHIIIFKGRLCPRTLHAPGIQGVDVNDVEPYQEKAIGPPLVDPPLVLHPDASETMSRDTRHLEVITDDEKLKILSLWENAMSNQALAQGVCASCGGLKWMSLMKWVGGNRLNLELLSNPNLKPHHWPTNYSLEMYSGAILDVRGLEYTTEVGKILLCGSCEYALKKGKMPKYALANDLYFAREQLPESVRIAFEQSSLFERRLICRARYNSVSCRYGGSGYSAGVEEEVTGSTSHGVTSELARARRGAKGNVMVVPADSMSLNRVIPPPSSVVKDTMCVVFVGTEKPTLESIKPRHKSPVLVRRTRVKAMIDFLMSSNSCYSPSEEFAYSQANFDLLLPPGEEEGVMPFLEIGCLEPTEAVDAPNADYTPRGDIVMPEGEDELVFENVGYTEGDIGLTNYNAMKYLAMERCRRGMPFILSGTGETPVPDFNNPNLLTWLFPHLDPWGIAGFMHPRRRIRISIEQQLRHLLTSADRSFERDEQFAFVFYNIVRKLRVASSIRFSVSPTVHRQLTTSILTIEPDTLADMASKYKADPWYVPSSDEEKRVQRVMASVNLISHQIPGSDGHKLVLRNRIRALINDQGPPTLFLTINPSDVDNPVVRLLAGENVDLDRMSGDQSFDSWQRRLFAAKHPAACALFFDVVIRQFIKLALQYDPRHPRRGVFGECSAYFGTVEAQGKGTLHCHMLIWLKGHLPPHELRAAMLQSTDYRDKVIRWVESIIKCEFPSLSDAGGTPARLALQPRERLRYFALGNPHPGTIPAPSTKVYSSSDFWYEYNQFLTQLLHEYHWHVHNLSCWKYLRKGERRSDENCRLRMDGTTREKSMIDGETGELFIRRHHPRIAAYNDLVTFMLKSNSELKFIGSGKAARDLVYYITDYVTKPNLPVHAGMVALQYALKKIGRVVSSSTECRSQSMDTSAVIATVNSMMGRHEISHPQVMSYLVGGGDHYASHDFSTLAFGAILKYVDRCLASQPTRDGASNQLSHTDNVDSTVSYTLDVRKDSVTTSNLQMDYVYRSREPFFDQLCLYDFVAFVKKEIIPERMLKDVNIEVVKGTFASWDHHQRASHRLVERPWPHIPSLVGFALPNPNRSVEAKELWAKYIVILFMAWRDPNELKGECDTWLQVYEARQESLTARHCRIIQNMNSFSESSDERATGPQSRKRRRDLGDDDAVTSYFDLPHGEHNVVGDASGPPLQTHTTDLPNPFLSFSNRGHLDQSLDQYISVKIGPEIVPLLDCCQEISQGDFGNLLERSQSAHVKELAVADLTNLAEHQSFMRGARQRRVIHEHEHDPRTTRTGRFLHSTNRHSALAIQPRVEVMTLANDLISDPHQHLIDPNQAVSQIIDQMNLASNPEQLRAFSIISNHLIHEDPKQLLMYVSGVGGTGKSHVIKSVVKLFKALHCESELLLGAPTGIAALLIGGQTLHSLAYINTNGRGGRNPALISTWRSVRYLIIDEVSMIGAKFLSQFSNRIREAKMGHQDDVSLPFGGVNVIFMGDFGQLKPPVQYSLYAHAITKNPSFRNTSSVDGISSSNGIVLWRQVSIVVELVQNQRHSADSEYSAFLKRLRLGWCRPPSLNYPWDDLAYLRARLLVNLKQEDLVKFKDAPVIVGSKSTRDALNAKLIVYHAQRLGEEVHLYHSVDSVNKAPVPIGLRNMLWNLDSTKNNEAFGRLPLCIGMRVMVTENIAFASGIVNGSEGVVQSIYYNEDGFGIRTLVSVYLKIDGCGVHLNGLDEDVVPIFPVTTTIKHLFYLNGDVPCKSFSRKQVPLVPAYVYTDFKSQGRTFEFVLVDLATARGQGVYVMLSRVKSLQGVGILRWFHPAKIYSRLAPELREELDRIAELIVICNDVFRNQKETA